MPFYVSPEQQMKDKADYARKGIARGRGLTAIVYDDGIAIVAESWFIEPPCASCDIAPGAPVIPISFPLPSMK